MTQFKKGILVTQRVFGSRNQKISNVFNFKRAQGYKGLLVYPDEQKNKDHAQTSLQRKNNNNKINLLLKYSNIKLHGFYFK